MNEANTESDAGSAAPPKKLEATIYYHFCVGRDEVTYGFDALPKTLTDDGLGNLETPIEKTGPQTSEDRARENSGRPADPVAPTTHTTSELVSEQQSHQIFWRGLNPKADQAPPYIAGIVTELVNLPEIPKSFRFTLQYVILDTLADGTDARSCIVSYDVVFAGERALRSATFDVLSEDLTKEFLDKQIEEVLKKIGLSKTPAPFSSSGFIDHQVEILGYDRDDEEILLKSRCSVSFRRSPYGEYASAYMLPSFAPSDNQKIYPIVVATHRVESESSDSRFRTLSAPVRQNLEALELAMSCSSSKIIFIQGEPGSGKEGFASAMHYGSRLNQVKGAPPEFSARSVAGMSLDQFRREVFGEEKDGVMIHGLIGKTAGGTIFLDEFDKLERHAQEAYSELLRVWESREFVPLNGRKVQKTEDINWVVAGAFTSTRRPSDLPPDIWSRFSAQLSIQSPISSRLVDEDSRADYIQGLILSFMLAHGLDKLGRKNIDAAVEALRKAESRFDAVVARLLLKQPFASTSDPFVPSGLVNAVARALARYVGNYHVHSLPTLPKSGRRTRQQEFSLPRNLNKSWIDEHWRPLGHWEVRECFDSIRSIRQACRVVFARLFEISIQRSRQKTPSGGYRDQVEKLLNEAMTTVDLARSGTSLERLVDHETVSSLRLGTTGVVGAELVALVAKELEEI